MRHVNEWALGLQIAALFLVVGLVMWFALSLSMEKTNPSFDRCESLGGKIHKVDYTFKCIKDGTMVEL